MQRRIDVMGAVDGPASPTAANVDSGSLVTLGDSAIPKLERGHQGPAR